MLDPLERLIDGVRNHPVLYRIKGRKRLRKQKEGLWEEVGQLCGLSGVDARTSFETTRKRYIKERKTANRANWKYFGRMKFLDAVIRPRATKHEIRLLRGDQSTKDTKTEAYHLIELVKSHPELYEVGFERDQDVDRKLWETIGETLSSTAEDEKEKFNILRSRFVCEQRTLEKDPAFRSTWPYYEKLSFLANSIDSKEHIEKQSEETELLADNPIVELEKFEAVTICRFCALEKFHFIETECVPNSTIAQLFENVTNIKLTFSSAFPTHVCTVCEEQLQNAHRIQQKFKKIDEFWHRRNIPFASVILNDPSAEFEVKLEPLECEVENEIDHFRPDALESNEMEAPPPLLSNCIELRIEKIKKINETNATSMADDLSSAFFCYMCDRSFFTANTFNKHNAHAHKQQGPFSCDYCAKEFVKKKRIEAHMVRVHTTYQCKYCSKRFTTSNRLDNHEKRLHNLQPNELTCQECNKIFRTKQGVSNHIRQVHCNLSDHACPLCSKIFSSRSRMRDHLSKHRRQRDKACPHCPSKFFRDVDLTIHIRIHTNERPYCCEVCAKTFKTMGELRLHFGRMHGPESGLKVQRSSGYLDNGPFKCTVCGCSYKAHKSLHNHLLAAHPYVAEAEWIQLSQLICKKCNQIFDTIEARTQHFCSSLKR